MILKIKKFFKSYTTPPPDYYIITNTLKWCYTHNDSTPEEEWKYRWGASVTLKEVDGKESAKLKRKSNGFCGYEWMIDSICQHGCIKTND